LTNQRLHQMSLNTLAPLKPLSIAAGGLEERGKYKQPYEDPIFEGLATRKEPYISPSVWNTIAYHFQNWAANSKLGQ
jgi:hypothetical protein